MEIQQNNAKVDLSLIQPCPKIENLKANSYIFYSDESVNYFMYKFPQLKTLVLNEYMNTWYDHDDQGQYYDYCNIMTSEVISRLIKFIFRIPSYTVTNILTHNALPVLADIIKEEKYSGIISVTYTRPDLQGVYGDPDISLSNQNAKYFDLDDIRYHRPNSKISIDHYI